MSDYWTDFVQESEEHITELNNSLLALERSPDDEEAMEAIFRAAHTLKGNCGAMGLTQASDLAHAIEDLLDAVRTGDATVTPELMDTVFDGVDELEAMIDEVAAHGEVRTDPSPTIDALRRQIESDAAHLSPPTDDEIDAVLEELDAPTDDGHEAYFVRLSIDEDGDVNNGILVVDALIDAFDLIGTEPDRETIATGAYGDTFDAVFGTAVGESSIAAALEPVDAVTDFEIVVVTDRFEPAAATADAELDVDDDLSSEEANEMSVDELLGEFDEFDDLDAMVEDVGDVSAFDDMGEAGSFDDLFEDEDDLDPESAEPESADDEAEEATADESESDADDADDVDDASAVFDELKEEVEMVGFDELQDELDDLEFDEFDSEDEVGMDELLGDDVDVDDPSFLEVEASDAEDFLVEPESAADDDATEAGPDQTTDATTADPADDALTFDEDGLGGDSDAEDDPESTDGVTAAADADEPATVADRDDRLEESTAVEFDDEKIEKRDEDVTADEDESADGETDDFGDAFGREPTDASFAEPADEPDQFADAALEDDGFETIEGGFDEEFDDSSVDVFDDGFDESTADEFDESAVTDSVGEFDVTGSVDDHAVSDTEFASADEAGETVGDEESELASRDARESPTADDSELVIPDITVPDVDEQPETDETTDQIQSMRVDVDQIDSLLNLVEGLVTSRVRLRHAIESGADLMTIDRELDDLDDITSDLQETVMEIRLVPLQTVVSRLPRVVRDIAREQDKDVALEMSGEDVELDRSILDRIGDPLIHLVRNAVDHGIEPPEEREAAGKPREGTVELRADRARDRVTIEIEDDGNGLDPDRLRSAAVDADVLTEAEAADLSDDDAYELVFHPGLSTADEVTDISGRGVGMDVVRRTIDDLDGTVSVESEPGEGTTFTLSLPVTVAIADVLFVESGGEEFGVPTKVVHDVETAAAVESGRNSEFLESDGEDVPVVDLADALDTPDDAATDDGMFVRIRDGVRPVALRCDEVHSQQEVVVKPFEGFMGDIPGLSGATVRGRGEVINILDVKTL
ncbi:Hpt domain-containing protein [Natribaculum luteum]|uniref:Chemotaxis protein CheA n=1 Tax=Natribaculum luteum TaxID=1586232 RepID=A0ABD5P511_9EURY|nr:chemotaxis protein CheA [Natribaculum luteum]